MPFEERITGALTALARPRELFESALIEAIDELNAFILAQREPADGRALQEADRLGAFAHDRIDVRLFTAVTGSSVFLDAERIERLEAALQKLRAYAAQRERVYCLQIPPGADLRDAVRDGIAARGSIFNVAHEVQLLRAGTARRQQHGALGFRQWSRLEKSIAPPLIVALNAPDLQVSGLAEYMDGSQKIVLLVDGAAAPAPLVRMIAPRTFVLQTNDLADLQRLAAYDGPGIAAVLPDTCARFCHDPARGSTLAQRLDVSFMPDAPQRGMAGGSVRQQVEELAWLAELWQLARATQASPETPATDAEVAPADQLAAWLLNQLEH
jgi:hypothetical protein